MKKIILTVAIALTAFTASYAQKDNKPKLTPEQRAEKVASNLKTKLSLSDEQQKKVYQIEVDKMKKAEEWRKANHETMKAKRDERQAFLKANDEKLQQVLTADQKKTYEAIRQERKSEMKDHKGHHRRGQKTEAAQQS